MKRPLPIAAALFAAAGILSCSDPSKQPPPVPAGALPAGTVLGSATIAGRVTYGGAPPTPLAINMASDSACHAKHDGDPVREDLVVGANGELQYVFVHVASGLEGKAFAPPDQPAQLDQRGCTYRPHMIGLQVGQPLLLVNSDPTLHNVHTVSQANTPFNFGMSVQGQKATRYFHEPEVMVKARCDVHPWMASYIGVVAHPFFAVTGDDGTFTLAGLPAGEYVVEAWHEKLGTLKQTVKLADGEHRQIAFAFPG